MCSSMCCYVCLLISLSSTDNVYSNSIFFVLHLFIVCLSSAPCAEYYFLRHRSNIFILYSFSYLFFLLFFLVFFFVCVEFSRFGLIQDTDHCYFVLFFSWTVLLLPCVVDLYNFSIYWRFSLCLFHSFFLLATDLCICSFLMRYHIVCS